MNGFLLRVLIEKKCFTPGIEIDATYKGRDLSGANIVDSQATFTLINHRFIGVDEVAMVGANIVDGTNKIFYARSIVNIEGMDPVRFAASCGIDAKGEKIQEGKRRGRKPKNRQVEIIVEDDEDDDCDDDCFADEIFEVA